jgi:hypothetical protein
MGPCSLHSCQYARPSRSVAAKQLCPINSRGNLAGMSIGDLDDLWCGCSGRRRHCPSKDGSRYRVTGSTTHPPPRGSLLPLHILPFIFVLPAPVDATSYSCRLWALGAQTWHLPLSLGSGHDIEASPNRTRGGCSRV